MDYKTVQLAAVVCSECKELLPEIRHGNQRLHTECYTKRGARQHRQWYSANIDSRRAYDRERNKQRRETGQEQKYKRELNTRYRQEALEKYGSSCVCCGETIVEFLSFDHVNGGGSVERQGKGHLAFYRSLNAQPIRPDIQILCHNCNQAKGYYGTCPHEKVVMMGA